MIALAMDSSTYSVKHIANVYAELENIKKAARGRGIKPIIP